MSACFCFREAVTGTLHQCDHCKAKAQVSALMPERVCLYKDSYDRIWSCDPKEGYEGIYVPESALLAAEARVREVGQNAEQFRASMYALEERVLTLRAERDALVELVCDVARSGVAFEDERLDYIEIQIDTDTWAQARAILAREER